MTAQVSSNRNERLLSWARGYGKEFRGKQAADVLGVKVQGIGPVLASMVRKGDLTVSYHGNTRMYVTAEEDGTIDSNIPTEEIGNIASNSIIDGLKNDFEDRREDIINTEIPTAEQELEHATAALKGLREELATVERTLAELTGGK